MELKQVIKYLGRAEIISDEWPSCVVDDLLTLFKKGFPHFHKLYLRNQVLAVIDLAQMVLFCNGENLVHVFVLFGAEDI